MTPRDKSGTIPDIIKVEEVPEVSDPTVREKLIGDHLRTLEGARKVIVSMIPFLVVKIADVHPELSIITEMFHDTCKPVKCQCTWHQFGLRIVGVADFVDNGCPPCRGSGTFCHPVQWGQSGTDYLDTVEKWQDDLRDIIVSWIEEQGEIVNPVLKMHLDLPHEYYVGRSMRIRVKLKLEEIDLC